MKLVLGFLASGRGSNVEAILNSVKESYDIIPKVLISNNPSARALEVGRINGLYTFCVGGLNPQMRDFKIVDYLTSFDVNLVLLAGYVPRVGKSVLDAFPNRVLNIHPSLLPKYGGKGMYGISVHRAVIHSKDRESGATVHIVNEELDGGRILSQYKVPRYPKDTPETLAERVLEIEHVIYPQTIKDIQRGLIHLD